MDITASSASGMVSASAPAPLECFGVVGVLREQEEFSLGLGVEEQGSGADVGLVGNLLRCHILHPVLSEQLAGCGSDAVQLLLLVPLAPSERLRRDRHEGSSGRN